MADNTTQIFLDHNNQSGGRGIVVPLNSSQVISLISRNTFEVTVANADIILTLNAASVATSGAFSYFKLKKTGTGNLIVRSASLIGEEPLSGGFSSQTISVNGEGFGIIDAETSYTIDRDTRLDLATNYITVPLVSTSASPITAISAATYYNVDASNFEANILLPDVVAGDIRWWWFTLKSNSNHCNISTVGGQIIKSSVSQSLSTENATLLVIANGVSGYDIFLDTRVRKRIIRFTTDIDLLSGFESGALYVGAPADGVIITATIANWIVGHRGDSCDFTKDSGEGSTVRIKSVDEIFDESIVTNDDQFELQATDTKYKVGQDNRAKPQDASITLYALTEASTIVPYKRAAVKTTDPDFNLVTATDVPTGAISGLGQLVGAFITDQGVIRGLVPASNTLSIANWRRISGNGTAQGYAKIYKYSVLGVETLLATTNKTLPIESATYIQNSVSALIPETTWANDDRVLIKSYMDRVPGGADPSYELQVEGANPARVAISLPFSTISHQALPDSGVYTHAEIDAFLTSKEDAMVWKGDWNASTNSPTLSDATGTKGDVYACSLGAIIDLGSGDIHPFTGEWIVHNGTIWEITPSLKADLGNNIYVDIDSVPVGDGGINTPYQTIHDAVAVVPQDGTLWKIHATKGLYTGIDLIIDSKNILFIGAKPEGTWGLKQGDTLKYTTFDFHKDIRSSIAKCTVAMTNIAQDTDGLITITDTTNDVDVILNDSSFSELTETTVETTASNNNVIVNNCVFNAIGLQQNETGRVWGLSVTNSSSPSGIAWEAERGAISITNNTLYDVSIKGSDVLDKKVIKGNDITFKLTLHDDVLNNIELEGGFIHDLTVLSVAPETLDISKVDVSLITATNVTLTNNRISNVEKVNVADSVDFNENDAVLIEYEGVSILEIKKSSGLFLTKIGVGQRAIDNDTGLDTIGIGYQALINNIYNNIVAIGTQSGSFATAHNDFIIANAAAGINPMMKGNFGTGALEFFGALTLPYLILQAQTTTATNKVQSLLNSVGTEKGFWNYDDVANVFGFSSDAVADILNIDLTNGNVVFASTSIEGAQFSRTGDIRVRIGRSGLAAGANGILAWDDTLKQLQFYISGDDVGGGLNIIDGMIAIGDTDPEGYKLRVYGDEKISGTQQVTEGKERITPSAGNYTVLASDADKNHINETAGTITFVFGDALLAGIAIGTIFRVYGALGSTSTILDTSGSVTFDGTPPTSASDACYWEIEKSAATEIRILDFTDN